jgi:hypothetical protein
MALNELGARHLNCRAMSLYHSQPPADYGGFGEFNGFSFRHYLADTHLGVHPGFVRIASVQSTTGKVTAMDQAKARPIARAPTRG